MTFTCAHCKEFTIKDHPEQAAMGLGLCNGFLPSALDFIGYDDKPCRTFREVDDIGPRNKWIAMIQQKNTNKGE